MICSCVNTDQSDCTFTDEQTLELQQKNQFVLGQTRVLLANRLSWQRQRDFNNRSIMLSCTRAGTKTRVQLNGFSYDHSRRITGPGPVSLITPVRRTRPLLIKKVQIFTTRESKCHNNDTPSVGCATHSIRSLFPQPVGLGG